MPENADPQPFRFSLLSRLLLLAALLALLPFIWISFYTHAQCDDLLFASAAKQHGLLGAQWYWYTAWLNRYTSTVFNTLASVWAYRTGAYFVIPLGLLVVTFLSVWYFLVRVFGHTLPRSHQLMASALFVTIWVCGVRTASEALFWSSASITYVSGFVFAMLLLGRVLGSGTHSRWSLGLIGLLAFLTVGCSELAMAWLLCVIALGVLVALIKRQNRAAWLASALGAALGTIVVLLSPGNAARAEYTLDAHQPWFTISRATDLYFHFLPLWFVTFPVFAASLLIVLYVCKRHAAIKLSPPPWWVIALGAFAVFALAWVLYAMTYWTQGWQPPGRVRVHVYMVWLAGWLVVTFFFALRLARRNENKQWMIRLNALQHRLVPLLCLALTVGVWLGLSTRRAIRDLGGSAQTYHESYIQRDRLVKQAVSQGRRHLVLPPLAATPHSLYYRDFFDDPSNKYNQSAADLYGVESVIVVQVDKRSGDP